MAAGELEAEVWIEWRDEWGEAADGKNGGFAAPGVTTVPVKMEVGDRAGGVGQNDIFRIKPGIVAVHATEGPTGNVHTALGVVGDGCVEEPIRRDEQPGFQAAVVVGHAVIHSDRAVACGGQERQG